MRSIDALRERLGVLGDETLGVATLAIVDVEHEIRHDCSWLKDEEPRWRDALAKALAILACHMRA